MGYSLPVDDFIYRAFCAARSGRKPNEDVRCSVVDKQAQFEGRWFGPSELKRMQDLPDAAKNAQETLGPDNVRYLDGGIPNVFLGGGSVLSPHAVERLLKWNGTCP